MTPATMHFAVKAEDNQLRGIENCTLVFVADQFGTVHEHFEFARENYDDVHAYRKAVDDCKDKLKAEWAPKVVTIAKETT